MSLTQYRRKRNFKLTKEPFGQPNRKRTSLYLIQKHAASHLHYDLRLELKGVLKSWAIPKGPCLDSNIKRLAVHVEDHPIEYARFEGIIPKGQYGSGTVMLWDKGIWKCENADPELAYKKGSLSFTLQGKKLRGNWNLIRLSDPKNWLLIKSKDKFSRSKKQYDVLIKNPYSVASHRSLEEIASFKDNENFPKKTSRNKNAVQLKNQTVMPSFIHPQLATLVESPPTGKEWIHEIKFDGYRIISFINNKKIKLMTRNQKDWTSKFTHLTKSLQQLRLKNAILDGELVALNKNSRSDFQLLQNAIHDNDTDDLIYYVFDLLYFNGTNLIFHPLKERKKQLKKLIPATKSSVLYSEHILGRGDLLFKKACKLSLEGIISKNKNSLYSQKRNRCWLKIKCIHRQEFIVIGFTAAKGTRQNFGSLLLAFYSKFKQLNYCGNVGTGFNETSMKLIKQLLSKYITKEAQIKAPKNNQITWVKPKIIVEIAFTEWTKKGMLRHPSFKGVRYDKQAQEVIYEKP